MLNFIWRFDDRDKPIFATALVTPKMLLISKVFKSDLKKVSPFFTPRLGLDPRHLD